MKQLLLSLTVLLTLSSQLFSQANLKLYGFAGRGGATGTLYYGICNDVAPYTITLDGSASFNNTTITPGSHTLQIVSTSSNVYKAVLNYDPINGISASFPVLPVGTNTFTAFVKRKSNTGVSPSCNGSFTIAVNGNAPPFVNNWYNSGTIIPAATNTPTLGNLCSGNYGFYATDNTSCPASGTGSLVASYTVGTGSFPIDMGTTQCAIMTSNLSCNAVCTGSAQLMPMPSDADITNTILNGPTSANGGFGPAPISITNQCAGMVNGIVMDATGAQAQCFWTISEPTPLVVMFNKTNATAPNFNNGSYTVLATGGTPAYSYSPSPTVQNLTVGTYTACVADANGCVTCNTVSIAQSSAINELLASEYTIYPTLTDNELMISSNTLSLENIQLHLISLDGKDMDVKMEKNSKQITLFLNNLSNGVYILKINTETKSAYKRIIVKH